MIDTHAHLNIENYEGRIDQILAELKAVGVEKVVIPGVVPKEFDSIINLIEKYDNLYGAVGVQPEEISDLPENWAEIVEKYCDHPKIVAVGEIGLDYYWIKEQENHERQKEIFIKQIEIAKRKNLPVLIHDREAHGDTFDILKEYSERKIPVVMHCFSGSPEFAQRCLKEGWYLALGGVVTFKNAKKTKEVAKIASLDRLLLETDSPYLTPVPHRGEENSPVYVKFVAEEIAKLREISFEEVDEATTANAKKIFNFGEK